MFYSSKNKSIKQDDNIVGESKVYENEIIIISYNDLKNDNFFNKNIDVSKKEVNNLLIKLLIVWL